MKKDKDKKKKKKKKRRDHFADSFGNREGEGRNMGHGFSCVLPLERERRKRGDSLKEALSLRSSINRCSRSSSSHSSSLGRSRGINGIKKANYEEEEVEEEVFVQKQQQALAMILLQQQLRFERSSSVRTRRSMTPKHGSSSSSSSITAAANTTTNNAVARSSSVRVRHPDDPVLQPHELISTLKEGSLRVETNHFLLIHGGGFGAWCWYKLIATLEGAGFVADAIDLSGSGIDSTDPNSILGLDIYTKPLIDWLENLNETKKVILVGHDIGGVCISYAMEMFPRKIAKSIFISATMITDGQRAFDAFSLQVTPDDLLSNAQVLNYADKDSQSPTSIVLNKDYLKDLFFNQTPAKDFALAMVSIRPIPFAPVMERISLTLENYGSIPRFYVSTTEDRALPSAVQENLVNLNPPNRVFKLKGSDHSPFFSRPQALFKVLLEIAQLDGNKSEVPQ